MRIPLEDNAGDILGKAQRDLRLPGETDPSKLGLNAAALRTNRENILSLPDDTVICPGHGPVTTGGEEKMHHPFFAKEEPT